MVARTVAMTRTTVDVGSRIRDLRHARGWTQLDLATRLGRTKSLVSHWERGKRAPGLDDIRRLAGVFGIDTCALLPPHPHNSEAHPMDITTTITRDRTCPRHGHPKLDPVPDIAVSSNQIDLEDGTAPEPGVMKMPGWCPDCRAGWKVNSDGTPEVWVWKGTFELGADLTVVQPAAELAAALADPNQVEDALARLVVLAHAKFAGYDEVADVDPMAPVVCVRCCALVPNGMVASHGQWHDGEVQRIADALARLGVQQ